MRDGGERKIALRHGWRWGRLFGLDSSISISARRWGIQTEWYISRQKSRLSVLGGDHDGILGEELSYLVVLTREPAVQFLRFLPPRAEQLGWMFWSGQLEAWIQPLSLGTESERAQHEEKINPLTSKPRISGL